MKKTIDLKKELVNVGKEIASRGLIVGPGGNTSARSGETVYMKASGICFESAQECHYIGVNLKTGKVIEKTNLRPTCEILIHLGCYIVRKDICAVIHTHPPYSTAYAMIDKPLRAFTPDMVAVVGECIPVVKYVIPGTSESAEEVMKFIKKGYNGVFMKNHGLLTVGSNLKEAFYRTLIIEDACKTVISAKVLGKMIYFNKKQIKQIDELEVENYRRKMLKLK